MAAHERVRLGVQRPAPAEEQVSARVVRSEAPTVLEEEQDGKTFSRRVRYTLSPVYNGTMLKVEDDVEFKGLGKLG